MSPKAKLWAHSEPMLMYESAVTTIEYERVCTGRNTLHTLTDCDGDDDDRAVIEMI